MNKSNQWLINPVIQKKVTIMPFSDESYSPTTSSTNKNKVKKWIVITIETTETTEKDIWVNICSKVEKIIKIMKKARVSRFYGMEIRN